jgi:hypothetical protein
VTLKLSFIFHSPGWKNCDRNIMLACWTVGSVRQKIMADLLSEEVFLAFGPALYLLPVNTLTRCTLHTIKKVLTSHLHNRGLNTHFFRKHLTTFKVKHKPA